MKNKGISFSPKLFWESVRRLRLIGVVGLILLVIANSLVAFSTVNDNLTTLPVKNSLELNLPILAVLYLFVPMMMLVAFSFLNHRNGSDFFAAAPVSRECLFFSLLAAVLFWCAVLLLGSTAVALLCSQIFRAFYSINLLSFWVLLFNAFAGSVLMIGVFAIAVSVTGTIFTNVMVALLILVLPRVLIGMMVSSAQSIPFVEGLVQSGLPWILDGGLNVVNWPISTILYGINPTQTLLNASSGVYTLCVGVILIAAGGLLFHFRKSETAEKSAPNRVMQAVYRLSLALLVTLPCCELIFLKKVDGFLCFVLYTISIVVYFLYELITTKKPKNLLRAAPALLILVVLNVGIVGGKQLVCQAELNFQPAAGEIYSVRILSQTNNSSNDDANWFNKQISSLEIDDAVINEIVSRNLSQSVSAWKESDYNSIAFHQQIEKWGCDSDTSQPQLLIATAGKTRCRRIYLNTEDLNAFTKRLNEIPAVQSAYCTLPAADAQGVLLSSYSPMEDGSLDRIYETLRQEVSSIDFTKWFTYVQNGGISFTSESSVATVILQAPFGTATTKTYFNLYPSLFPKTCAEYLQCCLPLQEKMAKITANSLQFDNKIEIHCWNMSSDNGALYSFVTSDNLSTVQELIKQGFGKVPESDKPFISIGYYDHSESDHSFQWHNAYFPIESAEAMEKLQSILGDESK